MLTRGESTKDKLIRAAITIAARDGLSAATTAAIAAEASVAEGTLYRHYKGKDDLIIDAFRKVKTRVLEAATAQLRPDAPIRDRVLAAWRAIFEAYRADPDAFTFASRFTESALAEREGGQAAAAIMEMIKSIRRDGVAEGAVKDLHPDVMRSLFYAPLTAMLKMETAGRAWSDAELRDAAEAVWDSWSA